MSAMRAMLAAIPAGKGTHEDNLAAHLSVLQSAAEAGCDLAVFPKFSLTGSIDPDRRPGAALAVDSHPVAEVLAATARLGVGAIFGIAERASGRFFITQLYAHGGFLHGHYRKSHLGEGERGFTPGETGGVFRLGAAWFGIALGADGGVDSAFAQARRAGAQIVFSCSPGLAALVDPLDNVVGRLEDRRTGTLVVDIPISVMMEPIREAVRTLIVDETGRGLLVRFEDDATGLSWWCPPGGGLEPGEDHLEAARRELSEEVGREDLVLGAFVGRRTLTFCFNGVWTTQRERWLACRTAAFTVSADRLARLALENVREVRWWAPDDLVASGVLTAPSRLAALIAETASGARPDPRRDLGH